MAKTLSRDPAGLRDAAAPAPRIPVLAFGMSLGLFLAITFTLLRGFRTDLSRSRHVPGLDRSAAGRHLARRSELPPRLRGELCLRLVRGAGLCAALQRSRGAVEPMNATRRLRRARGLPSSPAEFTRKVAGCIVLTDRALSRAERGLACCLFVHDEERPETFSLDTPATSEASRKRRSPVSRADR